MPWRRILTRPGSPQAVLVWTIVASVVLMLLGERARRELAGGVVLVAYAPFGHLKNRVEDIFTVYSRNQELEKRLVEMMLENVRLMEAGEENKRLRKLLDFELHRHGDAIAAEVLGPSSPGARSLWVDVGTRDSVHVGRPVVTVNGLVGKTIEVKEHSALVRSIWDFGCKVAAIDRRSRVAGIVERHRAGHLRMSYVSNESDILPGDSIISSGWGDLFPAGIPIGEVTRVDTAEYSYFQIIELTPYVDFENLEEVFVLAGPPDTSVMGEGGPR